MSGKKDRRKRNIPERLGNDSCGVSPYVAALLLDVAIHLSFFFFSDLSVGRIFRLSFSFLFFIYPLCYVADILWSMRPSVKAILSGEIRINRKYYMNVARREVERSALFPVTISVPVYTEENEVIFATLQKALSALERYREYSGIAGNVLVSDDGLAPMLESCSEERISELMRRFREGDSSLTPNERKSAERIHFYRTNGISFVARPKEGRPGLFKKSSNLNYTIRLGNAVQTGRTMPDLIGEGGDFQGGYAEGDVVTREIILLLDKDSGVKGGILEAVLPEFSAEEKLAYVQCATEAENLEENWYTRATGEQVKHLFHVVWPCKAMQGYFVPLIGHNVFLRKNLLEKSGLWSEDKVSEDYDLAIRLYALGFHGKYAHLPGLEFTEYASRTFVEETEKQRRYAYGLFEMLFDGTVIPGKTRGCDLFYMLLYFCSALNEVLLLPTVLLEAYFGNIHFLWAGFLVFHLCFLLLPLIRAYSVPSREANDPSRRPLLAILLAVSFVGHSYAFLSGAVRYFGNKVRSDDRPFPSTGVDRMEYQWRDGLKLVGNYLKKNPGFVPIALLCFDRGVFLLTRRGVGRMTVFAYCYILFCAVFSPLLLMPPLWAWIGRKVERRREEGERMYRKGEPPLWADERRTVSPRIVDGSMAEDVASFLEDYEKALRDAMPLGVLPEELDVDYVPESCLKRDAEGKKELYLLRRKDDGSRALLRITRDYPEEDAFEEAKLLRRLDHEGIPKVYAAFQQNGAQYLVREYLEGRTLHEIVEGGVRLRAEDIFGVVLKLTEILGYLHGQVPPVIHRDIKPQNIISASDGSIRLIDFGIAREHKEERTQDTSVILTLDYASPEQYGFEQTTPLSDIYSLGMVMLYLATGSTDRTGIEARIVNNRLRELIQRCTVFDPKLRIRNVGEIRAFLLRDNGEGEERKRRRERAGGFAFATFCLAGLVYFASFRTAGNVARKRGYERGYRAGYIEGYDAVPTFRMRGATTDLFRGNSEGNEAVEGGAFVVEREGLVFYTIDGDIYRMSARGGDAELFIEGAKASGLSSYYGWLYYSSGDEIRQTDLYTGETAVLWKGAKGKLTVVDGRYYIRTEDELSLLDTKTGVRSKVRNLPAAYSVNLEEDAIYYLGGKNRSLYRASLSEGEATRLLEDICRSVCVFEGQIYASTADGEGGRLLRFDPNSGRREVLAEVRAKQIHVTEDAIYYLEEGSGMIHRASLDGRIRELVSKNRASDFNVVGGGIFYHNESDAGRLWCVGSDGTNDHPVETERRRP